jgi:hypothetical protein
MMRYITQRLRMLLPVLLLVFALGGQAVVPASALACGSANGGSATDQVKNGIDPGGSGSTTCSGTNGVKTAISAAVTVLSVVIGAAAVIMILVSGFRYITSGGDSNKVSAAKGALIYALVGLLIAALAQLLVHFVLHQANNAITPPATPPSKSKHS